MSVRPSGFSEAIRNYFLILDRSLESLSHKKEGRISGLPSWCLTSRDIVCGFTPDATGLVLRVVPRIGDGPDTVQVQTLTSTSEMLELIRPWEADFTLDRLSATPFVAFGDATAVVTGEPLLPPVMTSPGLIGWGRSDDAIIAYSEDSAKHNAVDHWNAALRIVTDWARAPGASPGSRH
jgi:hypothetical protein